MVGPVQVTLACPVNWRTVRVKRKGVSGSQTGIAEVDDGNHNKDRRAIDSGAYSPEQPGHVP